MATTDATGMPFYGTSDPIEPIQNLFNGISTAVSTNLLAQTQTIRVADVAGRAAAVTARTNAGRPVTVADPIKVWRADAVEGTQEEVSGNGTDWRSLNTRIDVAGSNAADIFIKAGDVTIPTTNANGDSSITFPSAFPNALFTAMVQDATPITQLGQIAVKVTMNSSDRTRVTLRCYGSNGAVLPNVPNIRLTYMAVGR